MAEEKNQISVLGKKDETKPNPQSERNARESGRRVPSQGVPYHHVEIAFTLTLALASLRVERPETYK